MASEDVGDTSSDFLAGNRSSGAGMQPSRRLEPNPSEGLMAGVEYGVIRESLIAQFRKGRVSKRDICDAHPELLRAARNIGRPSAESCPICQDGHMVHVTYAFGNGLPSGGRCVTDSSDIARLKVRIHGGQVACYVIEVCPGCAWNHLIRLVWA
ncbi:MAG: DUF5318 domain-containing protein [Actinobacteria bacterium]|nr:DUF5318 domain-containing protein [Actinomycetota bacterium]MCL5445927.1 DUF5318 domain-containing protein [Actinomycetota bacterium]